MEQCWAAAERIGIHLYDIQSFEEIIFIESLSWLTNLAFSPDGAMLASSSGDGPISLWDVESLELIRTLAGHTDNVSSVAFSPDGRTLASRRYDDTIRLWNAESGTLLACAGRASGGAQAWPSRWMEPLWLREVLMWDGTAMGGPIIH